VEIPTLKKSRPEGLGNDDTWTTLWERLARRGKPLIPARLSQKLVSEKKHLISHSVRRGGFREGGFIGQIRKIETKSQRGKNDQQGKLKNGSIVESMVLPLLETWAQPSTNTGGVKDERTLILERREWS